MINQKRYDCIRLCPKCQISSDKDYCPKCKRKITHDQINVRRPKDLVDICSKVRYEFKGLSVKSALEILNNGDCGN